MICHRIQHSSHSVSDVLPGLYCSVVCLEETGRSFELNVERGVARLEKKYGNIQVIARNSHILSPTLYSIWINDVLKSAFVEAKKPMKQKRTMQKDKTQLRPQMLRQSQLLVQITKMILQYLDHLPWRLMKLGSVLYESPGCCLERGLAWPAFASNSLIRPSQSRWI